MSGRFKAVSIGAGYFSEFQYEAWGRIPEVTVSAVHNRTEAKAREKMAAYEIERYYEDWREMIDREQPDFVDIMTPPETHEEICRYAAERDGQVDEVEAGGGDGGGENGDRHAGFAILRHLQAARRQRQGAVPLPHVVQLAGGPPASSTPWTLPTDRRASRPLPALSVT